MTLEQLLAPARVLVPLQAGSLDVAVEMLLAAAVWSAHSAGTWPAQQRIGE